MTITVIIFSVLVAQGSASFFSELSNSFTAVGASVEKLINDAASDIKDTVKCTVYAVQQALNAETGPSDYYDICQPKKPGFIQIPPSRLITMYISPITQSIPRSSVPRSKKPRKKDKNKVNARKVKDKDLNQLEKDVKNVKGYLEDENGLLANMNSTFEHKLNDLSKHVEDDYEKIQYEKQLSLEKVIKEVDKLHVDEEIHQNNTDTEIRAIFQELLSKAQKYDTEKSDWKSEVKLALAELEQNNNKKNEVESELKQWKAEELNDLNNIKDLLKESKQTRAISPITETKETTERPTFTTTLTTAETGSSTVIVTSTEATTTAVLTTTKPVSPAKITPKPSMNYESLLSADQNTLEQAKNLIGQSRKNAALMDAILKDIDKTAVDLFAEPELLGR